MMTNIENKKRIMHSVSDDYYTYAYSILLVLWKLKCFKAKKFKDVRKVSLISELIKSKGLLYALQRNDFLRMKNPADRALLLETYTNGKLRSPDFLKILFSLEKKGFLVLEKNNKAGIIDAKLCDADICKNLFKNSEFENELQLIGFLGSQVHGVNSINYETFVKKVFGNSLGLI